VELSYYVPGTGHVVKAEFTQQELNAFRAQLASGSLFTLIQEFEKKILSELATATSRPAPVHSPELANLQSQFYAIEAEADKLFSEAQQFRVIGKTWDANKAESDAADARNRGNQLRAQLEQLEVRQETQRQVMTDQTRQRLVDMLKEYQRLQHVAYCELEMSVVKVATQIDRVAPSQPAVATANWASALKGMYPMGVPDDVAWRYGVDPATLQQPDPRPQPLPAQVGPVNHFNPAVR
jgi:hypothetical protein